MGSCCVCLCVKVGVCVCVSVSLVCHGCNADLSSRRIHD